MIGRGWHSKIKLTRLAVVSAMIIAEGTIRGGVARFMMVAAIGRIVVMFARMVAIEVADKTVIMSSSSRIMC
jgi:hypothetical protein